MAAGWVRFVMRSITVLVTVALLLTIGAPLTAPGGHGGFPLGWLTGWLQPVRAWSAPADPVLPKQQSGTADGKAHLVPASATRTTSKGTGQAPVPGKGQLADYHPHIGTPVLPGTVPALGTVDPKTSTRVAKDATARSDTYKNADGSYTRRVFARPVNYRAADGSWQPIDSRLVAGKDGRLHTTAGAFGLSVAGPKAPAGADVVSLTLPSGAVVGQRLDTATSVDPVVRRATVLRTSSRSPGHIWNGSVTHSYGVVVATLTSIRSWSNTRCSPARVMHLSQQERLPTK